MKSLLLNISDNLLIKTLRSEDSNPLFNLVDGNREYLRQWLSWVDHTANVSDSRSFIKNTIQEWDNNTSLTLGIWHESELSGVINFHKFDWRNKSSGIGYWLAQDKQGHGIITQACEKLIEYGFSSLKLSAIDIYCSTENQRSRAIASKLGFVEGSIIPKRELIHGQYIDHAHYSISVTQWNQMQKSIKNNL